MTGKVDPIEFVEGSTISPKKGRNLLGKMNLGGFSDFAEEINKKDSMKNGADGFKKVENVKKNTPKSPKK